MLGIEFATGMSAEHRGMVEYATFVRQQRWPKMPAPACRQGSFWLQKEWKNPMTTTKYDVNYHLQIVN